jgi:ABC-type spermidine/putrescine transport system permease subunit II
MIVLPIALPGIVTGIALNAAFRQVGFNFGYLTLIIAHATFCIVVLYNNMLARFSRLSPNLEEASADLGAHTFQTFRFVTFPQPSFAVQVRMMMFVQPTVLVSVFSVGIIGPWHPSTNSGALKLGMFGHSIVASRP